MNLLVKGRSTAGRVGNLALYLIIPLASAATPLLVIPSITSTGGARAWAAVAIAQSLGSAGALVCELGWGVTGPQEVAGALPEHRRHLYEISLTSRLFLFAVIIWPVSIATALLVDTDRAACIAVAVGSCAFSLSPSWYFIGLGMPLRILFFESIPRVALSAAAAGLILLTKDVIFYGLSMILSVVFTLVLVSSSLDAALVSARVALQSIRRQSTVGIGRVVGGLYTALPIAIVGISNAAAVPEFAAVERLMRMASLVLVGFSNRLQGWIGSVHGVERRSRIRGSLKMHLAFGLVAGLLFAAAGPSTVQVLFTNSIHISYLLSSLSGCVLLVICVSRGFGLALVGVGSLRSITFSAIIAALLGVPLIAILSLSFGAVGAVTGEVSAEVVGLILQIGFYARK